MNVDDCTADSLNRSLALQAFATEAHRHERQKHCGDCCNYCEPTNNTSPRPKLNVSVLGFFRA